MTDTLRVVSLQAQNVLRLSAIDIQWQPDKALLTIGGKNGAGKSSTIQCIAMALGGLALCPEEPLRRGELRGHVELNLGEFVVRRDFWRNPPTEEGQEPGEVQSRLVVRNADGMKLEPAQKLLDKLISKFSFDPTAFVFEDPKRQDEILRKIVGLDTSTFDEQHKIAYDRRAVYRKQLTAQEAVLASLPSFKDAPTEEISVETITQDMLTAEKMRKAADELRQRAEQAATQLAGQESALARLESKVTMLQQQLDEATRQRDNLVTEVARHIDAHDTLATQWEAAKGKLPDESAIRAQLTALEETNRKVRANQKHAAAAATVAELRAKVDAEHRAAEQALNEKAAALRAAAFPVPGLGLSDHGVTFHDLPFAQAATSEQIRVSVAIGFALNPTLKLLCVKNGNALDEENLALLAAEAEKAGGQVLMEYVTKDPTAVSVMIEDGHTI